MTCVYKLRIWKITELADASKYQSDLGPVVRIQILLKTNSNPDLNQKLIVPKISTCYQ